MPAIPPHNTATTDAPWSGATQERKLKSPVSKEEAQGFYAWRDPDGADPDKDGWPDYKSGYKFGHHMVSDGGMPQAASTVACSAGIAVLNGARGGTAIPSADKQGVYDHLAKHLKSAGKEPPAFGSSADDSERFALELAAEEGSAYSLDDVRALIAAFAAPAASELESLPEPTTLTGGLAGMPLTLLGHSLWAIRPDVLPRLIEAHRASSPLARELAGELGEMNAATRRVSSEQPAGGKIAVVPLTGVITPRGSLLSMLFGGGKGGLEGFREQLNEAVASTEVSGVVLNIDSPGGLVDMVPETAAVIRDAKGQKPIVAVANTMAASAAYWLGSQADELVVTPSGQVGSVGVYMAHEDWSGWNAQKGIVPTYISAGRFKTEGNPDEPLSDAARESWQQDVNDLYDQFTADVAAGRGVSQATVKASYGEGRTLLAPRALDAGMVDRVASLNEVVAGMLGGRVEGDPEPAALAAVQQQITDSEQQASDRARAARQLAAELLG